MAFGESSRQSTISIGDGSAIVHHIVKNEILHRSPSGSQLSSLVKHFNKGTRSNRGLRLTPSAEMKGRDGHSFAYILHYLSTGDLIYPLHEGFHRVDVLLKELTFFGLVEDVMRYATQEGSGRSKTNKRRSILFSSRDSQYSDRKVETLPKRVPMVKCQSIQNVNLVSSRSLGRTSGVNVVQSASLSDLNVDRLEGEVHRESSNHENQPMKKSSRGGTNDTHSHRFLNAIKRYLSLKSFNHGSSQTATKRQTSGQDGAKATMWSPRQVQPTGNGVFRPNSARGSTLILISGLDNVVVYGQRIQLEIIFADYPIEALRSFSSVFIDSKLIYSPDDSSASGDGDGYSSSSFNSVSSLPKRSGSASSNSTASVGQSDLLFRLFRQQIQPHGFVITVQSYWRNNDSLEIHHQWLLHKKHSSKQSGSGRRRSSQPSGITSSVSTTTLSNPVGRRASVLQRLFNKSELTLHTDV